MTVWPLRLGDGVLGVSCGCRLTHVLGEEVDQDDATEIGGYRLGLDGDAVEHPLRQVVFPPPALREVIAFLLAVGEGPARVRDLEDPLLPAKHKPVDRDSRPVRGRSYRLERVDGDPADDVPR
jgi:hypothetical protein